MKKISIIGTVGIPAKYGGFETLVEYLTRELANRYQITVYCSSKAYSDKIKHHNNANLVYIPLNANGAQSIPYDILSMLHAAIFKTDAMLILGVSGCLFLPLLKLFYRKPIIVNIDGLEWKREKWSNHAKKFLKFSETMAVRYADHIVTDNKVIQDYVWDEYGKASSLIAYGADHVQNVDISSETRSQFAFVNSRYAFKVCRIEPENNVHMILEAFKDIETLPLVIVGNWRNSEYGKTLREQYNSYAHIYLLDPIYDQNLLNQLRSNCALYVHGHSAGGTNPSLVEAMYLGLPVMAYGVGYNKATTHEKAIYFHNAEDLAKLLETVDDVQLRRIADEMQRVAQEEYRWAKIAEQYAELF